MNNFQYYAPTKVVFGKETENQAGALAAEAGAKKVLVHFGGQSAVKSGLIDRVSASLKAKNVPFVLLGGVVPNPRLSKVNEGIALCKKEGIDFLLAVGGGSAIDSAKAIGYGLANEGDVWDFYEGKRVPAACAPIGVVLTIAATGSEMSNSSVITNEDGFLKRGCNTDLCRPKFAIMNPELTFSLPPYQIASGAADIMMHTLERWFGAGRDNTALTDALSAGLLRTVIDNVKIFLKNPSDYNAAGEVLWAGSLSHNGLTGCGGSVRGDWACHQLEHELGGLFDVTHGAGLCAVWGSWARYVYKHNPGRFAKLGAEVFGIESGADSEKAALKAISAMEDFFRSINMPVNLRELKIEVSDEQIKELAFKCSFFGKRKIGSFAPLDIPDIEAIFRASR
jgi:alcohol dehydrogenase YqhD (iron-dependent ADH family)